MTDASPAMDLESCSECRARWAENPAKPLTEGDKPAFTICDVRKHKAVESCWLVAHGKVYDCTPFIFKHPGGSNSILRHAGQESDEDFDFHSASAQAQWKQFEIGVLKGCKAHPGPPPATISCAVM